MNTNDPMILEKLQIWRTSSSMGVSSVLPKWKTWCAGFQNLAAAQRRCRLTFTSATLRSLDGMPHVRNLSRSPSVSLPIHSRRVSEQCIGVTRVGKPIAQVGECRQLLQYLQVPTTKVVVYQIIQACNHWLIKGADFNASKAIQHVQ